MSTTENKVIYVTPVIDTAVYASGDLIADTTEIPFAVTHIGGSSRFLSLNIQDAGAQAVAFKVYVMAVNKSFGTINSAPNISDANITAAKVQAIIDIATSDWVTLSGSSMASRTFEFPVKAVAQSLYFAIVNGAGGPDYVAATDLVLGFGFAP